MLYLKQPPTSTHHSPPPKVPCGREECDRGVAWVGDRTYSKVSFLSWQLGEAQKAVPKSNSASLTSVSSLEGGGGGWLWLPLFDEREGAQEDAGRPVLCGTP